MNERIKIGVCLGASNVSIVYHQKEMDIVVLKENHQGKPVEKFKELRGALDFLNADVLVTGRDIREKLGFSHITEPKAIQKVLDTADKEKLPNAIVSFGGQTTIVYQIDNNSRIIKPLTFNKCGSGTGDFFLQQIKRLGFEKVEDAVKAALDPYAMRSPYVPASRCSVFCKSDCTHAANEQKATTAQIVAGICKMIANKIAELLAKFEAQNIWIVGGGSQIAPIVEYLKLSGYDVFIPDQAEYFEAWGAYLIVRDNEIKKVSKEQCASPNNDNHFSKLTPLTDFTDLVEVKQMPRSIAEYGDRCFLSVDVGSTTTKLVIIKLSDMSIVADYYGYTLGKPHLATIEGLKAIKKQLGVDVDIVGIIVTGSGRYLVETFLTDFGLKDKKSGKLIQQVVAVNEIICHARAAEYFNPGVRTVMEIGGQDAKYTQIANGVAVDCAMNEACSAGTGSFLAEVVKEIFKINEAREIAPIALKADFPLKFGEQCSAFIESDINLALTEDATVADVIAGLCYSICYNYINRVVGNRPINGPISLQGGTAYNYAFCLVMAGVLKNSKLLLEGEKLIVSSDAGLMGAIGGGLDLKEKIDRGEYKLIKTTLDNLISKKLIEGKSFNCNACGCKCEVQNFIIDGHKVPFGGSCQRWESIRRDCDLIDPDIFDLTAKRDKMLFTEFSDFGADNLSASKVGILGNMFDLSLMPFYSAFFSELGFQVVMADKVELAGVKKQGSAFCWPIERSHGLVQNLIDKEVDFYFLPHIKGVDAKSNLDRNACPFVQGLPYYLKASFPQITDEKILQPFLDFALLDDVVSEFNKLAVQLGKTQINIFKAFKKAWAKQVCFEQAKLDEGYKALGKLESNPDEFAIVVFGRPYNAFSNYLGANKGIARKIASSGVTVIPLDFLPLHNELNVDWMYWTSGENILKGAQFVSCHPQLFPVYLTNFSCGPDGFINFAFREIMESKPSLTLEFDAHTANAGFDTRIEAFMDIIKGYRKSKTIERKRIKTLQAEIEVKNGTGIYVDSNGKQFPFQDKAVKLVYTDMGVFASQAISAVTESLGIKSIALSPADEKCMQIGRRYSSCKECLPYNLTLGSFLNYLENRDPNERTIFFMPTASGPCRFGIYNQFMKMVFNKLGVKNVAVMSLSAEDRYAGLGGAFMERVWISIVVSDVFDNMSQTLKTLAVFPKSAEDILQKEWKKVKGFLQRGVNWKNFLSFRRQLKKTALELKKIPLKNSLEKTPKILITGEIYVRRVDFTTSQIVNKLVKDGFVVWKAPVAEWIKYQGVLIRNRINKSVSMTFGSKVRFFFEGFYEKNIIKALSLSGLSLNHVDDVDEYMKIASSYISPLLQGEAILTTGSVLKEVFENFAGAVVIGPFGCMPTRVASSILNYKAKTEELMKITPDDVKLNIIKEKFGQAPIMFIEADGSPLPPITLSQLEVFSMIAENVGKEMIEK